jgi:hypothetical protein
MLPDCEGPLAALEGGGGAGTLGETCHMRSSGGGKFAQPFIAQTSVS